MEEGGTRKRKKEDVYVIDRQTDGLTDRRMGERETQSYNTALGLIWFMLFSLSLSFSFFLGGIFA